MADPSNKNLVRTLIFLVLAVAVIWYLIHYSAKRHSQFEEKAQACMDQCLAQGYAGADFKWAALSQEKCTCLGE